MSDAIKNFKETKALYRTISFIKNEWVKILLGLCLFALFSFCIYQYNTNTNTNFSKHEENNINNIIKEIKELDLDIYSTFNTWHNNGNKKGENIVIIVKDLRNQVLKELKDKYTKLKYLFDQIQKKEINNELKNLKISNIIFYGTFNQNFRININDDFTPLFQEIDRIVLFLEDVYKPLGELMKISDEFFGLLKLFNINDKEINISSVCIHTKDDLDNFSSKLNKILEKLKMALSNFEYLSFPSKSQAKEFIENISKIDIFSKKFIFNNESNSIIELLYGINYDIDATHLCPPIITYPIIIIKDDRKSFIVQIPQLFTGVSPHVQKPQKLNQEKIIEIFDNFSDKINKEIQNKGQEIKKAVNADTTENPSIFNLSVTEEFIPDEIDSEKRV